MTRSRLALPLTLLALAACAPAPPRPPGWVSPPIPAAPLLDSSPPRVAAPSAPESAPIAPAPDPGRVLLSTAADLDGQPGPERVALLGDGTLVAGSARGTVDLSQSELTPDSVGAYFFQKQAAIRVVDLDRRRRERAILVALPTAESEDPPNRYQLFTIENGSLRRVLDRVIGTYGVNELRFPGDGTARYIEDGWSACERLHDPSRTAIRREVILRLDRDGEMREAARARTALTQRCDQLAG
jgi:hypothetical protein